jgi:hypothetical protein
VLVSLAHIRHYQQVSDDRMTISASSALLLIHLGTEEVSIHDHHHENVGDRRTVMAQVSYVALIIFGRLSSTAVGELGDVLPPKVM